MHKSNSIVFWIYEYLENCWLYCFIWLPRKRSENLENFVLFINSRVYEYGSVWCVTLNFPNYQSDLQVVELNALQYLGLPSQPFGGPFPNGYCVHSRRKSNPSLFINCEHGPFWYTGSWAKCTIIPGQPLAELFFLLKLSYSIWTFGLVPY